MRHDQRKKVKRGIRPHGRKDCKANAACSPTSPFIWHSDSTLGNNKKIMTGTKVLKIFWTIVFLPFTLLFSLIFSLMKVILVWVFGVGAFGKLRYAVKMFSDDLTSKTDRKSFRVAVRRQQLFLNWSGKVENVKCLMARKILIKHFM